VKVANRDWKCKMAFYLNQRLISTGEGGNIKIARFRAAAKAYDTLKANPKIFVEVLSESACT